MHKVWWAIIIVLIVIVLVWIGTIVLNHHERRSYYELAKARSVKLNKPLIVIGDPQKGMSCAMFGPPYGYGDACVDIDPVDDRCVKSDATEYLKGIKTNSAVIFISCVLEYVDDIEPLIEEMNRVAGSSKNLFVVHVKWYALTAYIYRAQGDSAKNVITGAPPNQPTITYFRL